MRYSTPFVWRRGRAILNRALINTYREIGVPETLFMDWIDQSFPTGTVKRRLLVARAYDNAHRTRTHLAFPEIADLPDFTRID